VERLIKRRLVLFKETADVLYVHSIDGDNIREKYLGDPELRAELDMRIAEWLQTQRTEESTWRTREDVSPQLQEIRHRLRAGDGHRAIKVMMDIAEFLATRGAGYLLNGALIEARKWADTSEARAAYQLSLGLVRFAGGSQEDAVAEFRTGLDAAERAGDDILTARLDMWLGKALQHVGELEAAGESHRPVSDLRTGQDHLVPASLFKHKPGIITVRMWVLALLVSDDGHYHGIPGANLPMSPGLPWRFSWPLPPYARQ